MRFEWDDAKGKDNQKKHHLSFDTARLVFSDPLTRSKRDTGDYSEERWQAIGRIGPTVVLVAHADREENGEKIYRIVSAQRATSKKTKRYEEGEWIS